MPGMRRREFVSLLGGAAATWPPLAAQAQQLDRMLRIGVLTGGPRRDDPDAQANIAAFLQALQQLGWTDGRNVRIEYRWGMGDTANIRKNAEEGTTSANGTARLLGVSAPMSERREASVPRHGARRASLARTSRVSQTRQQR